MNKTLSTYIILLITIPSSVVLGLYTAYGISYAKNYQDYNMTTGCPIHNLTCYDSNKIFCYGADAFVSIGCMFMSLPFILILFVLLTITAFKVSWYYMYQKYQSIENF